MSPICDQNIVYLTMSFFLTVVGICVILLTISSIYGKKTAKKIDLEKNSGKFSVKYVIDTRLLELWLTSGKRSEPDASRLTIT